MAAHEDVNFHQKVMNAKVCEGARMAPFQGRSPALQALDHAISHCGVRKYRKIPIASGWIATQTNLGKRDHADFVKNGMPEKHVSLKLRLVGDGARHFKITTTTTFYFGGTGQDSPPRQEFAAKAASVNDDSHLVDEMGAKLHL